jgi:hypothetical protein
MENVLSSDWMSKNSGLEIHDLIGKLYSIYLELSEDFNLLELNLDDNLLSKIVHYLSELECSYSLEFCSKFYDENQERIRERLILE